MTERTIVKRHALATLFVTTCLLIGCAREATPRTENPELPLVVVYQYPGYPLPGKELDCGLILAVWPTGRVARVSDLDNIGRSYVEGRLSSDELLALVEKVRALQHNFPAPKNAGLIVDASSVAVYLRLGKRLTVRHESVTGFVPRIIKLIMQMPLADEHEIGGGWRQIPPIWKE